jgi:hypothetical protein
VPSSPVRLIVGWLRVSSVWDWRVDEGDSILPVLAVRGIGSQWFSGCGRKFGAPRPLFSKFGGTRRYSTATRQISS